MIARDEAREQELAEKYNLTPIFMEDKIDGSDVAAVEWPTVVSVLDALDDNLREAEATIDRLVMDISSRVYEREMAKLGRDEAFDRLEVARGIIERAHHESIAGDGRSSVVLAVVREILAKGVEA